MQSFMQSSLFLHLVHFCVRCLFKVVAQVDAKDTHPLQQPGTFIVASNHLSNWDAPLVYLQRPSGSPLVPLAAEKWRKVLPIRLLFEGMDVVWIKRGEVDREALRSILKTLKSGKSIGIAPEGTRSKTHQMQLAKSGVAWLARSSGVPVIPVAIWGVECIAPNLKRLRRTHVYIRAAPPITLSRAADPDAATQQIMQTIADMLPEKYRGAYQMTNDE